MNNRIYKLLFFIVVVIIFAIITFIGLFLFDLEIVTEFELVPK